MTNDKPKELTGQNIKPKITFIVTHPDGSKEEITEEYNSKRIYSLMPNGSIIDSSIILTIQDIRDKEKTELRMLGGSPQMIMSAKKSLMIEIPKDTPLEIKQYFKPEQKIELVGNYDTDNLAYFVPGAFTSDKNAVLQIVNNAYSERLHQLEKERSETLDKLMQLKANTEIEKSSLIEQINKLQNQTKDDSQIPIINLSDYVLVTQFNDLEREKIKEIEKLEQIINESISISQHSQVLGDIKNSYMWTAERGKIREEDKLTYLNNLLTYEAIKLNKKPEELTKEEKTKIIEKTGMFNERYLNNSAITILKQEEEKGIKEGNYVFITVSNHYTHHYIGRLFFNDTNDYLYLAQGVEILLSPEKKDSATEQDLIQTVLKNPLSIQVFFDNVKNMTPQNIEWYLHELRDKNLKIRSISGNVLEQLVKMQPIISYDNNTNWTQETRELSQRLDNSENSLSETKFKLSNEEKNTENEMLSIYSLVRTYVVTNIEQEFKLKNTAFKQGNTSTKDEQEAIMNKYRTKDKYNQDIVDRTNTIITHMNTLFQGEQYKEVRKRMFDNKLTPEDRKTYNGALEYVIHLRHADSKYVGYLETTPCLNNLAEEKTLAEITHKYQIKKIPASISTK